MTTPVRDPEQQKARNMRRTMLACAGLVVTMTGLAFAAVPLYALFCRVTGFGGTPMIATEAAGRVSDRVFTVRLDANVAPGLGWTFVPEQPFVTVRAGETATVFFKVHNIGTDQSAGMATFNVQPDIIGGYFNKLQCFCFNEMVLKPGETLDAPVVFFVDPAVETNHDLDRVATLSLSYTFFPAKRSVKPLAEVRDPTQHKTPKL
jgi:cytochrome c oxidase assembly protein subunit 11